MSQSYNVQHHKSFNENPLHGRQPSTIASQHAIANSNRQHFVFGNGSAGASNLQSTGISLSLLGSLKIAWRTLVEFKKTVFLVQHMKHEVLLSNRHKKKTLLMKAQHSTPTPSTLFGNVTRIMTRMTHLGGALFAPCLPLVTAQKGQSSDPRPTETLK